MKVVLTDKAISDLIRIGAFIRQDNPNRAVTFVAELEQRCEGLADVPFGFALLPGREASGIRRRPHKDYLIFYRVDEAGRRVDVLHVIHGAQNYERILFSEE